MPMDSIVYQPEIPWSDDIFKRLCIGWELKFAIWPRRCYYTNKRIWLKTAYMGTAMITGPGTPVFEYRWCDKASFVFLKIKGTV